MIRYNHFLYGIALGLGFVIIGFGMMLFFNDLLFEARIKTRDGDCFAFDERTLAVLGTCFCLIPFSYARRRRLDKTLNGIVLPVLIVGIAFAFWTMYYPDFRFTPAKVGCP